MFQSSSNNAQNDTIETSGITAELKISRENSTTTSNLKVGDIVDVLITLSSEDRKANLKDCYIGPDENRIPIIRNGLPANYFHGAIWSIRKEFLIYRSVSSHKSHKMKLL